MDRCGTCGTDGKYDFKGQFISRDWLRACELQRENDRLREIEAAAKNLVAQKGRHHTEQAYQRLAELVVQPACAVRGMIHSGAMCGSMIVGGKCGHNGECQHKVPNAI